MSLKTKLNLIQKLKKEYEDYPTKWGFNGLGYLTYKRTYARDMYNSWREDGWSGWLYYEDLKLEEKVLADKKHTSDTFLHRTEELNETVARTLTQSVKMGVPYTTKQLKEFFKLLMDLDVSFSGRYDWQAGAKLSQSGFMNAFINCLYYNIDNIIDIPKIFDQLMLGCGVGFSVRKRHLSKLPIVQKAEVKLDNTASKEEILFTVCQSDDINLGIYNLSNKILYVGDSREGWVKLLEYTLSYYFNPDLSNRQLNYNTNLIRKKGEIIRGFGGKASGDQALIWGITEISKILDGAVGRQLTSVELLDLICVLGKVVVSGNVRRSALIAIGDKDDVDFITSKRWDLRNVPDYRGMANISIEANSNEDVKSLPQEFWDSYEKLGECIGLFNLENCREFGRMGKNRYKDKDNFLLDIADKKYGTRTVYRKNFYADPLVEGANPCFTGDMKILSENGYVNFRDNVGDIKLYNKDNILVNGKIWSSGIKQVIQLTLSNGKKIKCTPNHVFMLSDYGKIPLIEKRGHRVISLNSNEIMAIDTLGELISSPHYKYGLEVVSIDKLGEEEVFDFTLYDDTHWGIVEGVVAHNCAEATLPPNSHCDLAIVRASDDYDKMWKCIKYVYMTNKFISQGKYLYDEEQLKLESRIGIDICGVVNNFDELTKKASKLYVKLRKFDKQFSSKYGFTESIKLTVAKPNGTRALIMGVPSGVHFDPYKYYYRTVRFASNDSLIDKLIDMGYRVEDLYLEVKRNDDGTPALDDKGEFIPTKVNPDTKVVYFALKSESDITEENVSFDKQIEINRKWNEAFVDQSISQTVKYHAEDFPRIKEYLVKNWDKFKTISFLKHEKYNFPQMPIIPITEEEYINYNSKVKEISHQSIKSMDENEVGSLDILECANGICPVK